MKIAITGASGMIGSALVDYLTAQEHTVLKIVRRNPQNNSEVFWDPNTGTINGASLGNLDALVHLAGESIASGRWTNTKKALLRNSRIETTKLLCASLCKLSNPPKKLICASAIGYYGDRKDQILNEDSPPGKSFLSQLCVDWENATHIAKNAGIGVVNLRIGMVLSTEGGALAMMLPPFKLGLGGCIGSGKQYMSWIAIDDVVGSINHIISTDEIIGPVNLVAPNPVTNAEFTNALGHALHRPTIFPVPDFAARLLFGEMADELLLASTRVEPQKLLSNNYSFQYPTIDTALKYILSS